MNSFLLEYTQKCKSGKIMVGRELIAQLDMLLEDMERPEYRFDPTDAHKRINFIERECRHSISPFAGAPFLLELWEKAYFEALYGFYMLIDGKWLRRFTRSLLLIGRKNGKSTVCAADALAELTLF